MTAVGPDPIHSDEITPPELLGNRDHLTEEQTQWICEYIASQFHFTYEALAIQFGYETRPESAVPWPQVPANNRALMTAVVRSLWDRAIIL